MSVTGALSFEAAMEAWLEHAANLYRMYRSNRWKNIHPISMKDGSERLVVGLTSHRWLDAPSPEALSALLCILEERLDPDLIEPMAALLQRAAAFDPEVMSALRLLASSAMQVKPLIECATDCGLEIDALVSSLLSDPESLFEKLSTSPTDPFDIYAAVRGRLGDRGTRLDDVLLVMSEMRCYLESFHSNEDRAEGLFAEVAKDCAAVEIFISCDQLQPGQIPALNSWFSRLHIDIQRWLKRAIRQAKEDIVS